MLSVGVGNFCKICYHVFLAAIRSVVFPAQREMDAKDSVFCFCAVAALTWAVW